MKNALYIAALVALFGLLQWHEDYTEHLIRQAEAGEVRVVCDEPETVARR